MANFTALMADELSTVRVAIALIQLMLFVVGFANLAVMALIALVPSMRTVTNMYIFSLCLADLLYTNILPLIAVHSLVRDWVFGLPLCKLNFVFDGAGKYGSLQFVMVMAADRYLALCRPLFCHRYRSKRNALLISAGVWLVILLFASPLFINAEQIHTPGNRTICTVRWASKRQNQLFMSASFGVMFCLPAPIILAGYIRILRKLGSARQRSRRLRTRCGETRYRTVTRTVLAIISFYLCCWAPYWAFNILATFVRFRLSGGWIIVLNGLNLLPYFNSAFNPLIYALFTKDFRHALTTVETLRTIKCGATFSCCGPTGAQTPSVVQGAASPGANTPTTPLTFLSVRLSYSVRRRRFRSRTKTTTSSARGGQAGLAATILLLTSVGHRLSLLPPPVPPAPLPSRRRTRAEAAVVERLVASSSGPDPGVLCAALNELTSERI